MHTLPHPTPAPYGPATLEVVRVAVTAGTVRRADVPGPGFITALADGLIALSAHHATPTYTPTLKARRLADELGLTPPPAPIVDPSRYSGTQRAVLKRLAQAAPGEWVTLTTPATKLRLLIAHGHIEADDDAYRLTASGWRLAEEEQYRYDSHQWHTSYRPALLRLLTGTLHVHRNQRPPFETLVRLGWATVQHVSVKGGTGRFYTITAAGRAAAIADTWHAARRFI